jgi:Flp pilus assembly pilin Flp
MREGAGREGGRGRAWQREGRGCRMIRGLWDRLKRLERDETGSQGLEMLLIIAAIMLPLLGLLIIFRNEVREWVVEIWKKIIGEAKKNESDFISKL